MALQPDFGIISNGFVQLAEQFGHCANLPAVDQGAGLRALLVELREQSNLILQRLDRIDSRLDRSDSRLETMSVFFSYHRRTVY
jgi:hypothetical protein